MEITRTCSTPAHVRINKMVRVESSLVVLPGRVSHDGYRYSIWNKRYDKLLAVLPSDSMHQTNRYLVHRHGAVIDIVSGTVMHCRGLGRKKYTSRTTECRYVCIARNLWLS